MKAKNRDKAIQKIEGRFAASNNLKVGSEKAPGSGIFATKVFDFNPLMRMLTNQFVMTVCDDIIEHELQETAKAGQDPTTNDFLIAEVDSEQLEEGLKDERRGVLYRHRGQD